MVVMSGRIGRAGGRGGYQKLEGEYLFATSRMASVRSSEAAVGQTL